MLRCFQMGMNVADLEELTVGLVTDMITEAANDDCKYQELATQEDKDRF